MKFSLVIPVYNVAPYLRECLESLLAQSFTDWEAICVDDGATDGSGGILDEYAAIDERLKVFHQKNSGVSAARNFALQKVRGEYVGFLDGDDILSPDWLLAAFRALQTSPKVDWLRMGLRYLRENNRPEVELSVNHSECRAMSGSELIRYGWADVLPRGFPWMNFYRRNLVAGRLFNRKLRYQEDMYWTLELIMSLRTVVISNYNGYLYRQREDSACYCPLKLEDGCNNVGELLRIWQSHGKRLLSIDKDGAIRRQVSRISIQLIVERWGRLYAADHPEIARELFRLVRRAYRAGAFHPRYMWDRKSKIRWFIFVHTGWWGAFRPLRRLFK